MDSFKRAGAKHVDVGGYHCPCCGPAKKNRAKHRRLSRRLLRRDTAQILKEV